MLKDPKLLLKIIIGIIAGWLIMSSGEALLDKFFHLSDAFKFCLGLLLAYLGFLKL